MIIQGILLEASNSSLLFGYLPEWAPILIFGTCLIAGTIGLRKFLNYQDRGKTSQNPEKSVKE